MHARARVLSPPGPGASTDDQLSFIIANMAMKTQVATEADITASEVRIMKATQSFFEKKVSMALDPLKKGMSDFRSRLTALESRSSLSSGLTQQQIQMIYSMDIANRQVALTGSPWRFS